MFYKFNYEFAYWVSKNPVMGTILIIGIIGAIAGVGFLFRKIDESELKRRYKK